MIPPLGPETAVSEDLEEIENRVSKKEIGGIYIMWERLRDLSGGAKAGIVGGVVLLAAAGVGLGIPVRCSKSRRSPWSR